MTALLARSAAVAAHVTFLRDRSALLQQALTIGADPERVDAEAFDGAVLRLWTSILVPLEPWPATTQLALEELHLLHARIIERVARGGVADISAEIDDLVRALLVDNLQRATDRAVMLIT